MKQEITIRESTADDVHHMGIAMNDEERMEAIAMGSEPHKLLWRCYRCALIRKTIFVDGNIAAMLGVAGVFMGLTGEVYLVTSAIAREVSPFVFMRIYQKELYAMLELFPTLESLTDLRYTKAIKTMKLSGFEANQSPESWGNVLFQRSELKV
jgi:hypothetical protein